MNPSNHTVILIDKSSVDVILSGAFIPHSGMDAESKDPYLLPSLCLSPSCQPFTAPAKEQP